MPQERPNAESAGPQGGAWQSILTSKRLGWREIIGVTVVLVALAWLIYGWYAFHGGFVADDWLNSANYHFHPEPGFWGAVGHYQTPSRPVAAVYVSLTYLFFGDHFHLHLALAVFLTAFISIAFYAFLRTLGVCAALAFAASALLMVFPSSDSTRFWATGSQIDLFIGMYLIGTTIALIGRRRYGPEPSPQALAMQVLGSALTVGAVAGYEIVAPAVLLSFLLYRRIGRSGVLWRWALEAVPTVLILIFLTRKFSNGPAPLSSMPGNVWTVVDGAISVLGYTLIPLRSEPPLGGPGRNHHRDRGGVVPRAQPAPTSARGGGLVWADHAFDSGDRYRLHHDRAGCRTLPRIFAGCTEPSQLFRGSWAQRTDGLCPLCHFRPRGGSLARSGF